MRATPARRSALEVLRAVRRGELADVALHVELERLPAEERGWTQELVYGTLRLRARLDHMLESLVRRGLDSLEPDVLDVLRLGAYQLLEMGSVPAYAAVSQAVELTRVAGAGRGAAGLVNGVLQSLRRTSDEVRFPAFDGDAEAHLATWGSHPRWLVRRWIRRFGAEGARALVEANNRRPELYIRPIRLSLAAAAEALAAAGIGAEPVPESPDSLRILPPHGAREALAAVPAVVQDPAAALVARYAQIPPGARVADVCAAPGGKAAVVAADRRPPGYVAALDVSRTRAARVRENAERLAPLPLGLVIADARVPPLRQVEAVLLDAPCTGTGTLRRHPDGRWRLREADLESLAALQRELLDAAAELVAPGGLLVYATCSLELEENEEQVNAFLERRPGFEPAPPAAMPPGLLDDAGRLLVLPQRHGFDGSFAARLRRRGG